METACVCGCDTEFRALYLWVFCVHMCKFCMCVCVSMLHAKQNTLAAFNDGIHSMVRSLPAMFLLHHGWYELRRRHDSSLSLAHCFHIVKGLRSLAHALRRDCGSVVNWSAKHVGGGGTETWRITINNRNKYTSGYTQATKLAQGAPRQARIRLPEKGKKKTSFLLPLTPSILPSLNESRISPTQNESAASSRPRPLTRWRSPGCRGPRSTCPAVIAPARPPARSPCALAQG